MSVRSEELRNGERVGPPRGFMPQRGMGDERVGPPAPQREGEVERREPAPAPVVQRQSGSSLRWSGIPLLIFGVLGWVSGGRYTIEGWVIGLNWFLDWLGTATRIPLPVGWALVALVLPVALLYSRVEVRNRPLRMQGRSWAFAPPEAWVGWGLVVLTDVGSTFLGVQAVRADAWAVTQQIAASVWLAGAWAVILTFLPEWLMLGGYRLLKGKR